ncbi:LysR family glycine cleavage system transcriptional activator [Azonexus fungiphilus]|jgi:LysR family glycine cleavage system transcriptional activator|uniref:LysR family glycine cleavage system transcriptional activator n=1 Tax=Azonexus fungiphilus TaxID=146940 RepID=A0A495W924_9RHOO|nr:transcriptional regulator GcvA [Azonexus fungiphilus]NHC05324.1 transcriptional regulator GcvA [Azonexus fungiphilus]RKT58216.1 LysR family glycine cleavage system transcriptional activator [Azonexus fungiphilus]
MAYRLPPLPALRAFEAAARHLSFKKAAEELHVTPAAVSLQIRQLEAYLGLALFRRLTRAIELTAQGRAMLPKLREGFDCLAAAVDLSRDGGDGALTVHAPPSFASRWLVGRLPGFAAAHPGIALRLASDDDNVDRQGDTAAHEPRPVDPRLAESEVAIRYGTGRYPGLRVDKILAPVYAPVCSPQLLREQALTSPADLARLVLIHDETIADAGLQPGWAQWLAAAGVGGVDARRGLRFSNATLAVEAALGGQGVALAVVPLVEAELAAGRLVRPFALSIPSPYAYWLVMSEALAGRPAVAAFRDWILAAGGR